MTKSDNRRTADERRTTEHDRTTDDRRPADAESDWTRVVQRYYDPTADGELTTAILYAVAEARGVSSYEIDAPPLYEWIDAAALEETFFGSDVPDDVRRGAGTVEFRYVEFLVRVGSDGRVEVFESSDGVQP